MLPRRRVAALIIGALVLGLAAIGIHRVVRTAPLDEGPDEAAAAPAGEQSSKASALANRRHADHSAEGSRACFTMPYCSSPKARATCSPRGHSRR